MDPDELPRRSQRLLKLPLHLYYFPSKRNKVIKRGTHTSTYQTCDHTSMSTNSSQKEMRIPLTPIPTVVNGTHSTPSTTTVVALEVPIITPIQPRVSTQPIVVNPFGSIFGTPRYNTQSIPIVYNPFSFGMLNMTLKLLSSIPTNNTNPSIGPRGMDPFHIPLSFGGSHIPQTTPMVGSQPPFHPGSNPSLSIPRWSNQLCGKVVAHVSSFPPSSSTPIPTNTFGMTNPPLSSVFSPGGGQFHTMGNAQFGATPARGNIYNPHYNIPTGMVPTQHIMNQFRGGNFHTRHGHGAYQNLGWFAVPQHQYFLGAWAPMLQPWLPFFATLNFP
jgi:hypothetical protein